MATNYRKIINIIFGIFIFFTFNKITKADVELRSYYYSTYLMEYSNGFDVNKGLYGWFTGSSMNWVAVSPLIDGSTRTNINYYKPNSGVYSIHLEFQIATLNNVPLNEIKMYVYKNGTRTQATCDLGTPNYQNGTLVSYDHTMLPIIQDSQWLEQPESIYNAKTYLQWYEATCDSINITEDFDRIMFYFEPLVSNAPFSGIGISNMSICSNACNDLIAFETQKASEEILEKFTITRNSKETDYKNQHGLLENLGKGYFTDNKNNLNFNVDTDTTSAIWTIGNQIINISPIIMSMILICLSIAIIRRVL